MQIFEKIENNLDSILKRPILALVIIISVGIILRIYFTNWDMPSKAPDTFVFLIEGLSYANGDFAYFSTRFLWPGLLAVFFAFFHFDNNLEYFNLMRIISILISVSSVPLIYLISKLYVDKKYAVFASAIFAFEPNIIENSLFAITEPLFILCGLLSIYFLIQKNNKLITLSFFFAGLSFDTRLNGIVLVLLVLVFCILKIRRKEISIKLFVLGCGVLIFVILPHIYLPLEQGNIPFLIHFISSADVISNNQVFAASYSDSSNGFTILENSIIKELTHIVRISIPFLMIFVPIGIISSLKNFDVGKKILFSSIIISLIVAIPQYLISAEYRNLLFITPIFCILSAIGIQRIFCNRSYQNLLILFLLIGVLFLSFFFLKFQIDNDSKLIQEKEKFGKFVINNFSGRILGGPYNELTHNVLNARLGNNVEEGNIHNDKIAIIATYSPIDSSEKLLDTISNLKINYIIVDNIKNNRYPIFLDIFENENKYSYLKKVFDSDDNAYKEYHVKIFKINSDIPS